MPNSNTWYNNIVTVVSNFLLLKSMDSEIFHVNKFMYIVINGSPTT